MAKTEKKESLDVMLKAASPEVKASLNKVLAVKQTADIMAQDLMAIKITDDNSLAIATQNLSKASNMLKELEEKRIEIKKPYFDTCKMIDATAETIREELEKSIKFVKSEMLNYEKKMDEERKKSEQALADKLAEEEAKRNADSQADQKIITWIENLTKWCKDQYEACTDVDKCNKLRESLTNKWQPDEKFGKFAQQGASLRQQYIDLVNAKIDMFEKTETLSEAEREIAAEKQALKEEKARIAEKERQIQLREEQERVRKENEAKRFKEERLQAELEAENKASSTVNTRENWKFELVDKDKLIPDWMTLDDIAVKAYLKENKDSLKDGSIINGVKFYKEKTVVAK